MRSIKIDGYIINKPIIDILYDIQKTLINGKLRDIKPSHDYIMVSCPVHSNGLEKNPSAGIYVGDDSDREYGLLHCFTCGAVLHFENTVAEFLDRPVDFAKKWLIERYGEESKDRIEIDDEIDIFMPKKKARAKDVSLLDGYQSYCPYLAKRGVSREIAEKFSVKYDPKSHFILFPSFDEKGNLVSIDKRSVDRKYFVIDKDAPKVVYGLDQILKGNISEAIITEGQFDCLHSWTFGQPAIATLGGMSEEQIKKINSSCLTHIILAMDNDEAGREFTEKLKKKLSKRIMLSELKIPNGFKDIGDLDKITFEKILKESKNS